MLDVSEIVLVNALNRRESRGTYARLDYPFGDDERHLKHLLTYQTTEKPKIVLYPVTFTRYAPVERKY